MRMIQCRYCKNYFEGYGVGDYCSNDCIKKEVNEEFARKAQLDAAYETERQTQLLEQQIYEQKLEKLSNKFYSRECPQCAELVKRKAKICKECHFEFSDHKEQIEYLESWESRASKFGLNPWEKEAIEHEEWKISPEGQKVLEEQKRKIEEERRKTEEEKDQKRKDAAIEKQKRKVQDKFEKAKNQYKQDKGIEKYRKWYVIIGFFGGFVIPCSVPEKLDTYSNPISMCFVSGAITATMLLLFVYFISYGTEVRFERRVNELGLNKDGSEKTKPPAPTNLE